MAAIAKRTSPSPPSMCSTDPPPSKSPRGTAGELLAECDQATLRADGKVYRATIADRVRGQIRKAADPDEPCTITKGLRYDYCATPQTPGIDVFLSGTNPGGLDTVATGGAPPVGYVLENGTTIEFFEPR